MTAPLAVTGDPAADILEVLAASGIDAIRFDTLEKALADCPEQAGLMILAGNYPSPGVSLTAELLDQAAARSLRLFVEYPSHINGLALQNPRRAVHERAVTVSDFFNPAIRKNTILTPHACWFTAPDVRDTGIGETHIVLARVAGYLDAVYGLPDETVPMLYSPTGRDALICSTKLAHAITARYAPTAYWKSVWETILMYLIKSASPPDLSWNVSAGATFSPDEPLPDDIEIHAFDRCVDWFRREMVYSIDAKKGVSEGFESRIDHAGRQKRRTWPRDDCIGESALVFACDWALHADPDSRALAAEMIDTVFGSDFYHDDPGDPAFGLLNWYDRGEVYYGDDNARSLIAVMAASHLIGETRWDERILTCLLANYRTTGRLGFRKNSLNQKVLNEHGWRHFYDGDIVSIAPHYQAYLWAWLIWAWHLTGVDPMAVRTKNAIRDTMATYPDWTWTNGLTQELARMILPLAFLYRSEPTAEHHDWLLRVTGDLLKHLHPRGAIIEQLGDPARGVYPPPSSNERYGTAEASLIQKNGDPAADLLYTVNFAFLGLHEAAVATGDPDLKSAEDRIAAFLCRVQAKSNVHPYLDGGWMRAFDVELWEYYSSSSDAGWGAWCLESGWTNAWIASLFAFRRMGLTLFDLFDPTRFRDHLPDVARRMDLHMIWSDT